MTSAPSSAGAINSFVHRLQGDPLQARLLLLLGLWIVSLVAMSLLSPYFLQARTVPYLLQYIPILGLLAGFAALLYVARLRNVEINIGTTVALEAIAATILGGTSIRGGVGSLLGTLLGVVFIRIVQNGLVLVGISSLWETVIIGGLLIVVLTADALGNRNNNQRGA